MHCSWCGMSMPTTQLMLCLPREYMHAQLETCWGGHWDARNKSSYKYSSKQLLSTWHHPLHANNISPCTYMTFGGLHVPIPVIANGNFDSLVPRFYCVLRHTIYSLGMRLCGRCGTQGPCWRQFILATFFNLPLTLTHIKAWNKGTIVVNKSCVCVLLAYREQPLQKSHMQPCILRWFNYWIRNY